MKKYLSIVSIVYSLLFLYVWVFNKLNNYLSPQMQIYLIITLFVLAIFGIINTFNDENNYKFSYKDLVLLLPILFMILGGNGRLSLDLATNRMGKATNNYDVKKDEDKEYEFDTFEVMDSNYDGLSNYLTYNDSAIIHAGKRIKVTGFTILKAQYIPRDYYMIGKYGVGCCIADSIYTAFYIDKTTTPNLKDNTWYSIEGELVAGKDIDDFDTLVIKVDKIEEVDSKNESIYIYPCYNYGDGECSDLSKYGIET